MNLASRFLDLIEDRGNRPAIREANGRGCVLRRAARPDARLRRPSQGPRLCQGRRGGDPGAERRGVCGSRHRGRDPRRRGGPAEPGLGDEVYVKRLHAARPKWSIVHPIVLWANRIPGARALLRRREVMVPPVLPDTAGIRRVMVSNRILQRVCRRDGRPSRGDGRRGRRRPHDHLHRRHHEHAEGRPPLAWEHVRRAHQYRSRRARNARPSAHGRQPETESASRRCWPTRRSRCCTGSCSDRRCLVTARPHEAARGDGARAGRAGPGRAPISARPSCGWR